MSIRKGSGIILPSVARVATVPDIAINANAGVSLEAAINCYIIIDVTVDPALASVQPKLFYVDPASKKEFDLIAGLAAITAVGTTILKLGKDVIVAAGLAEQGFIPDDMTLRLTHADADSITYSVGIVAEFDSYK